MDSLAKALLSRSFLFSFGFAVVLIGAILFSTEWRPVAVLAGYGIGYLTRVIKEVAQRDERDGVVRL